MTTPIIRPALLAMAFAFAHQAHAAETCKAVGTPKANVAVVKKFYEAFNTKNKALLDKALDKNWVDVPLAPKQGPGLEGMKAAMDGYYASFPDFKVTNEDFVTEGNKVVVRSTIRATHKGEFAGVKPSGKPIQIMAIDLHTVCNGLITKTWHVEDWLTGLFEMGALPPKP